MSDKGAWQMLSDDQKCELVDRSRELIRGSIAEAAFARFMAICIFDAIHTRGVQASVRIEELEAKLARAVAIAEDAIETMESDPFFPEEEARRLRTTLTELTASKDGE